MNNLMSLIAVLAAVVAISSAMATPKVVEAAAHAPDHAHSGQATHKYPMELMKKKVLIQIAKIQNSDLSEEAKQIAITQVYDRYRKAAGAYPRSKKASSAAKVHAGAKPGLDDTAAKHPDMAQAGHLMHNLDMHVGGLRQQGQGNHHASSRMKGKRSHNGASLRRMAKGFADAEGQPGMTRKRRAAPVKKLRQSIARAI